MKTYAIAFLADHFITVLIGAIIIILIIIVLEKFGLFNIQNSKSEIERDDSYEKSNFLIDYDIRAGIISGVIAFCIGILIYLI